jgi:hypothetical protein
MTITESPRSAVADLRRLLSLAADHAARHGAAVGATDVLDALARNGDPTSAAVVQRLAPLANAAEPPRRRSTLRRLRPPRTSDAVRHSAQRALERGSRGEDPVAAFLRELGRTAEGADALRRAGIAPHAWDELLDAGTGEPVQ